MWYETSKADLLVLQACVTYSRVRRVQRWVGREVRRCIQFKILRYQTSGGRATRSVSATRIARCRLFCWFSTCVGFRLPVTIASLIECGSNGFTLDFI